MPGVFLDQFFPVMKEHQYLCSAEFLKSHTNACRSRSHEQILKDYPADAQLSLSFRFPHALVEYRQQAVFMDKMFEQAGLDMGSFSLVPLDLLTTILTSISKEVNPLLNFVAGLFNCSRTWQQCQINCRGNLHGNSMYTPQFSFSA